LERQEEEEEREDEEEGDNDDDDDDDFKPYMRVNTTSFNPYPANMENMASS
jgi:hypothetical protein